MSVVVYDRFNPPPHPGVKCKKEEDVCKQEFKDECDVNQIMARMLRTQVAPMMVPAGRYGDFSDIGEYQDALERVAVAQEQFEALPSKLRDRFGNDPAKFLAWVQDPANLKEANEFGLLSEEAKQRLAAANEPAPAAPAVP